MKPPRRSRTSGRWAFLGLAIGLALLSAGSAAAQGGYGFTPNRPVTFYSPPGFRYYGSAYYFWPGLGGGTFPWAAGAGTQYPMAVLSAYPPTFVTPPTPYVRTMMPTYGGIIYRDWDPANPGFANVFTWQPGVGFGWQQQPALLYPGQLPVPDGTGSVSAGFAMMSATRIVSNGSTIYSRMT